MTRTYACEGEEVGKRLAELREEAKRQLSCTCRPSDDGGRIETADCPIHRTDPGAMGLYWPPSAYLSDSWEELREQIRRARGVPALRPYGPPGRVLP